MKKQHKRANLGKIYNELIKTTDFENTSKEHLYDRINELIIQGNIVNKPSRNDDSYSVNESIVDFNIKQMECSNLPASDLSFATANTKQSSSIESENTPRHTINNKAETSHLPQKDINSKGSVRRIIKSQKCN